MKKSAKYVVIAIILLVAAFVYYYITIPAFNIHSVGTWWFVIGAVIVVGVFLSVRKMIREGGGVEYVIKNKTLDFSLNLSTKICLGLLAVLLVTLGIGALLSSPIINAKKYQQLMSVENRDFTRDISEVDYNTIPILDKDSAALLGNRKMGSMVDMVSQFEVSNDYSQINVNNKPPACY